MHHLFLGLWYALRDIALAVFDLAIGRRRRCYTYALIIDAPVGRLWPLVTPGNIRFDKPGLEIRSVPIEGVAGGHVAHMTLNGRPHAVIGYRVERIEEPNVIVTRYLPEHSDNKGLLGEDDRVAISLEPLNDDHTRIRYFRELTHLHGVTRILAPMGLRSAAWLCKQQAEADAGTASSSLGSKVASQVLIATATLASFWFIAGWADALLLVAIIALHELGHAAAMLMTGVGVRMVTLVPFFGGMAVPERQYASDGQMGFVAWAGPGLSLIPTYVLYAYARSEGDETLAHAAALFALINGFNLLPIPPLDGGVMLNTVLSALHRRLARLILVAGAVAMVGVSLYLASLLLGLVAILAIIQVVYQLSLDLDGQRRRLRWFETPTMLAALIVTIGAHAVLFLDANALEDQLRIERVEAGDCRGAPGADRCPPEEETDDTRRPSPPSASAPDTAGAGNAG